MSKYFLPCSNCGAKLTIDAGQAGQTVSCECGHQIEVPTLRGIQKLARADAPPPRQAEWSPRQGMMFSVGLALTVLAAGLCTYLLWERSKLDTTRPPDPFAAQFAQEVDSWEAEVLWDRWQQLREHKLGREDTPQYQLNRQAAQRLLVTAVICAAVSVAGLGLLVAAFIVRPGAPRKKPRGKPSRGKSSAGRPKAS